MDVARVRETGFIHRTSTRAASRATCRLDQARIRLAAATKCTASTSWTLMLVCALACAYCWCAAHAICVASAEEPEPVLNDDGELADESLQPAPKTKWVASAFKSVPAV
jgi:hypothetical protein